MEEVRKLESGRIVQNHGQLGVTSAVSRVQGPPRYGGIGMEGASALQMTASALPVNALPAHNQSGASMRQRREQVAVDAMTGSVMGTSAPSTEKRLLVIEELVHSLQRQMQGLEAGLLHERGSNETSIAVDASKEAVRLLQQQNRCRDALLAKLEARILAVEEHLAPQASDGKVQGQLLAVETQIAALDTKLAQKLSTQELTQESIQRCQELTKNRLDVFDGHMTTLLDFLSQDDGVVSKKDMICLQASSEAHEELLMSMDQVLRQFSDKLAAYKKEQDTAIRQFRGIANNLSKDLVALSADMRSNSTEKSKSVFLEYSTNHALPRVGAFNDAVQVIDNKITPELR
jgi:hypothetical protein